MVVIAGDDDRTLQTMNYMSSKFGSFKGSKFLGFIPNTTGSPFGVFYDGADHTACHILYNDWHWGDDQRETAELAAMNPWILMFLGCDNSSYMIRFETKDEALIYFNSIDEFDEIVWGESMFYNS